MNAQQKQTGTTDKNNYSMKLLHVFFSVQFKRKSLCLIIFMASSHNIAANIFAFMSVHTAIF